jgi:hypothetical protein
MTSLTKVITNQVQKLPLKMIQMFVILVRSISEILDLLMNLKLLFPLPRNFLSAGRLEPTSRTKRFIAYEKKIGDWDWALWVSTSGSLNEVQDTK